MGYNTRQAGAYTVVDWNGDVDLSRSPDAREQILQFLEDGHHVLVDLSAVYHIDTSGVAVLVEGHLTAAKKGLYFGLVAPSGAVMGVLQLAHMDEIFRVHVSIESIPP